jgi:hypothetical protein
MEEQNKKTRKVDRAVKMRTGYEFGLNFMSPNTNPQLRGPQIEIFIIFLKKRTVVQQLVCNKILI